MRTTRISLITSLALVALLGCGSGDDDGVTADASVDPDGSLPASSIDHGAELTLDLVGPGALGVAVGALRPTTVGGERISTNPDDGVPSWIPDAPYVYDDDPANHGGIVPEGGMTIDGFAVPAGTWVAQFDDFGDESIIISGDNDGTTPALPGIVFRGCRWRGTVTAPGFLNVYQGSHARVWILFSDAGGLGAEDADYNEIPFKLNDSTSEDVYFRNYVSYTSTAIQPGTRGPQLIENYVEKITYYYDGEPPPGESTGKHLNGFSFNGGQTHALVLRNKVLLQSPDDAGRTVNQTDCIYFKQEPDTFPGTGSNLDGSRGYQVKDNYVGGGGYTFYAGWDSSLGEPAPGSLVNMKLTGNQITTAWWPEGGALGPIAHEPTWSEDGNEKHGNTFAETGEPW